jgi:hypothetical protein
LTAIVTIAQKRVVHVLTDGASHGPAGMSLHPSSKIWPLPHLDAVVAGRGPRLLVPMLVDVLGCTARSYDELKSLALDVLWAYLPQTLDILRARGASAEAGSVPFDLVVAGISGRDGPGAFFVCNHEGHSSLRPWKVIDLASVTLMPLDDQAEAEFDREFAGRSVEDLDPEVDGARMLEIQRKMPLPYPIGGFVQLATVAEGSISTRIVRRWDV